jgi:hypothetical protein
LRYSASFFESDFIALFRFKEVEITAEEFVAQIGAAEQELVGGFEVGAGGGVGGTLGEAVGEFFLLMPDAEEVHDEGEGAAVVGFLYLECEAHERFGEFVEDLASERVAVHVSELAELLELAGDAW